MRRFAVGQLRQLRTLSPRASTSQMITPYYPGPVSFPQPPYGRPWLPPQRPEAVTCSYWTGAGSTGYWTSLGYRLLPQNFTYDDKLKATCDLLRSSNLKSDTWIKCNWFLPTRVGDFVANFCMPKGY